MISQETYKYEVNEEGSCHVVGEQRYKEVFYLADLLFSFFG